MNLILKARDLAYHLEKEQGQPGTASVIHALVAEIERSHQALGIFVKAYEASDASGFTDEMRNAYATASAFSEGER